ncbi:MAG: insulinase family protein [Clostridia bacterium]|nr:insulinase family protein [Clostridia bacterium]
MNKNDRLFGFSVKEVYDVSYLQATVYVMEYEKNGARLVYIDREDENKTFSISFKTLPKNSTGVFHIIEHSVLCGSKKYNLKDPFVELVSGSLNTFLNAMTFNDKTMYPVASTNEKEFLNLADVYLDAVFHPLAVKDKKAFMQEGWHYELSDSGELSYKGVVFNEMKGEYSSPEAITDRYIHKMLFEGTPYEHDSGGDPCEITSLEYEDFVLMHQTYYHPSNAVIFLDGTLDINAALSLVGGYLSEYEYRDYSAPEFNFSLAIKTKKRCEGEYEISDDEELEDKERMSLAHLTFRFDEREKIFGAAIISSALLSANESPIKKAILDSKLCEDLSVNIGEGIYQNYFEIDFINVKSGKEAELERLFYQTVADISESGIEKSHLEAAINSLEFFLSERDYGTMPLGVILAMNTLESFLYSNDPISAISFEEEIAFLRENMGKGFFEQTLREIFIENESSAVLILHPSHTLEKRMADEEREKLSAALSSFGKAQKEKIKKEQEELFAWQSSEDSEEARAVIPRLRVADISEEVKTIPTEISEIDGARVITHPIPTGNINYTELYFDVSDIGEDEIFDGALFGLFLGNLSTENYSANELVRVIKSELGSLSVSLNFSTTVSGEARIFIKVFASSLSAKKAKAAELVEEVLMKTRFVEKEAMQSIVKQAYISSEEGFSAGHRVAKARVSAMLYSEAAAREYYSGYEAHLSYKSLNRGFDEKYDGMVKRIEALRKKYLVAERLTVSVSSDSPMADGGKYIKDIISIFPKANEKVAPVCKISPMKKQNEGIVIPSKISFSVSGMNILHEVGEPSGLFDVAAMLASYEYLWGEIRVKGGAYGTGMGANRSGLISYYSYRDPTPEKSITVFSSVPEFLLEFSRSGKSIDKYIIGAIGEASPHLTPRTRGSVATLRYFNGFTDEMRKKMKRDILSATCEKLAELSSAIQRTNAESVFCIVGPREVLSKISQIDSILEI